MAHGADLEELARLRLDALRAVDDHDGRVRRHQRPVGILREVLMARRVQNVDAEALILELHDGRGHGNAALLFDLHPVGDRRARVLFALDGARLRDRSAVEQEFFGEGGLAGVRMRNDREGPAAADPIFDTVLFAAPDIGAWNDVSKLIYFTTIAAEIQGNL